MPTKIIRQPEHIDALAVMLRERKLPLTVSWTQGASRSGAQNRLSHRWYSDIARQLGDRDEDDVRAECKLRFGVPILRAENEAFRLSYDRIFKHLSYEEKIQAIKDFELPVTRLMTTPQMTKYMDTMGQFWAEKDIVLTDPEALIYETEFGHGGG